MTDLKLSAHLANYNSSLKILHNEEWFKIIRRVAFNINTAIIIFSYLNQSKNAICLNFVFYVTITNTISLILFLFVIY